MEASHQSTTAEQPAVGSLFDRYGPVKVYDHLPSHQPLVERRHTNSPMRLAGQFRDDDCYEHLPMSAQR